MINKNYIEIMNRYGSENLPFLFIINFDASEGIVLKLNEINPEEILFQIDDITNVNFKTHKIDNKIHLGKFPESYEDYLEKYLKVINHLKFGNSYLTNLTCSTKVECNSSMIDIFYSSRAKYKIYLKDKFVCFSPECFVNIDQGIISTYPMKGTISNKIPDALNVLLNDEKEKCEHNTIVDLLRNDLSIIAEDVSVSKFRFPTHIQTVNYELIQLSSEIKGVLPKNYNEQLGFILSKLLPAGSVTGAPKKKTVEIIKEIEDYDRGFYTGVFGIFKDGIVKSAVAIRFIENIENELFFKSGGGITINSNPESEYQEMIDKIYVPIA